MPAYIGRFAPSPTGPLHLGSLCTAVGSYLDARSRHGQWRVRIEDLDPPREVPGATALIIDSLLAHGLQPDGDILFQSSRHSAYASAIEQLRSQNLVYYCTCSRQNLQAYGDYYPGTCRTCLKKPAAPSALRLRIDQPLTGFQDRLLGKQEAPPLAEALVADFVIRRKDGPFAYQLAVVVDDISQGITDVVRGIDILDSTFRQLALYSLLGHPPPQHLHLPIITTPQGQKLSKQNLAPAIDNHLAADNLRQVLAWLQQARPPADQRTPSAILRWAAEHWDVNRLPRCQSISS